MTDEPNIRTLADEADKRVTELVTTLRGFLGSDAPDSGGATESTKHPLDGLRYSLTQVNAKLATAAELLKELTNRI